MPISFDDLRSRDNDTIDRDYLNRRWRLIAENIRANSDRMDGFAETEAQLIQLGLQRIDEVLGPALQSISSAAELGFLVQPSDTEVEMAVSEDVNFTLSVEGARGIFAPTPFLAVMDVDDETNWSVVKLLSYNKETGVLGVRPLFINGTGAGADWVISSSSGFIPAMESALSDTVEAKDIAVAAAASALADKNIVAADKATVLTYRNQAEAAAAAAAADAASVAEDSATIAELVTVLDDGPVLTVNGRVGAVTLAKTDVGLSNVDNTSDANKPISNATQTALDGKQATLVSGTNIKTVNGSSLLGDGDIVARAPVYNYANRGALRSVDGPDDAQAIVEGLGLFVFYQGSTEPDDDESCFAASGGRWLLDAAHWDIVDKWMAAEFAYQADLNSQVLQTIQGTASSSITSISANSEASFTATISGAVVGDNVIATMTTSQNQWPVVTARVTGNNTVTITLSNPSASSMGQTASSWNILVFRRK